ncbi:hypothetical protein K488DRAFT_28190, partial [Vararia minispora EC-137]
PFNSPQVDVILRTSDGVDFHLRQLVLSLASPFFKDIFFLPTLPSSSSSSSSDDIRYGKQMITISETSQEICLPLCVIYLGSLARPHTVADVRTLLHVCQKYDIIVPTAAAGLVLQLSMDTDPLRVFALCIHFGLTSLAGRA